MIAYDPDRRRYVDHLIQGATAAGAAVDRAAKLAAATHEIAAAAHHDSGDVEIRLWHEDAAVLCEVTDPTVIDDPMTGRSAAPTVGSLTDRRDRAIRLANELCDLVQVRSGQHGTTVRIHTRRASQHPGYLVTTPITTENRRQRPPMAGRDGPRKQRQQRRDVSKTLDA
jgi:hypothetical protein